MICASSARLLSLAMPLRSVIDLSHGAARGRLDFPELERLDVDAAPDRLALQDVDDVAHLELVVGDQRDLLSVRLDARLAVLEVEAVLDLFARLIERVVEFLAVDARNDVERGFARHYSLTLLLSKGEGAIDDVARLAELSDVLAVDVDLDAAGVADAHHRVLSVERLRRSGWKRTLHANTAVNGDPEPGRSRKHQGERARSAGGRPAAAAGVATAAEGAALAGGGSEARQTALAVDWPAWRIVSSL